MPSDSHDDAHLPCPRCECGADLDCDAPCDCPPPLDDHDFVPLGEGLLAETTWRLLRGEAA
jgi:hypothetical protein